MKPDQISKLPPELRKAAELCERFKHGLHVEYAASWLDVHAALTWCLQVVEERDRYKRALHNHLCEYDAADWLACAGGHGDSSCDVCDSAGDHPHTFLQRARERDELKKFCELQDQLLVCYRLQKRPTEKLLHQFAVVKENLAALSHTPEGKI